jgi:TPR repeat protein
MRVRLALACALSCALASSSLALVHDPNSPSSDTFAALVKTLNKISRADFSVIMQRANAHDPRAQMLLGIAYRDGFIVQRDRAAYVELIKLSAGQGYAAAEAALGSEYAQNGNREQAKAWFEKAVEQDEVDAEYNLAVMYARGEATPENHPEMAKAAPLFRKAALQGHPESQYILALAYHEASGVERDEEECKKWMLASAEQGYSKAEFSIAARYYKASDYKNAFTWFMRAAGQKHSRAELNVGSMYYVGEGTTKDLQQALYWFQRAAEHGEISALRIISSMYATGTGVTKDPVTSYAYMQAAADSGNQEASRRLEKMKAALSDMQILEANRRASELATRKEKPVDLGTVAATQP